MNGGKRKEVEDRVERRGKLIKNRQGRTVHERQEWIMRWRRRRILEQEGGKEKKIVCGCVGVLDRV